MTYKSTERQAISKLYDLRGDCDDILLVRNGCVADSSYTNIAMFDGDKWITPKRPIIYGTNRAYLLDNNLITEGNIAISDISKFQKIRMFNAMIEFGEIELDISSIILK
jgi:4-amino-4-deoxychorismate lyase